MASRCKVEVARTTAGREFDRMGSAHPENSVSQSSPFGKALMRLRLEAGLSQEALAERARMSAEGISALERGKRRAPQRETVALLVAALALTGERRRTFEAVAAEANAARAGVPRSSARFRALRGTDDTDSSRINNLPASFSSFMGRETELREIAALVNGYRLVTLTGAGRSRKDANGVGSRERVGK
jgi:transcriptional regulator with XRE-family HTH domain